MNTTQFWITFFREVAMFEATPNHDTESYVRSDTIIRLDYPHSIHTPKDSSQTARIRSEDGLKVALATWILCVYRHAAARWNTRL